MDFDEEGMVDAYKNVPFSHNSFDLFLFLNVFLLHRFESKKLACFFVANKGDLCEGALSDD